MATTIAGILETGFTFGTINTGAAGSKTIYFDAPSNIWSRPYLQMFSIEEGFVSLSVGSFVDNNDLNPGGRERDQRDRTILALTD